MISCVCIVELTGKFGLAHTDVFITDRLEQEFTALWTVLLCYVALLKKIETFLVDAYNVNAPSSKIVIMPNVLYGHV